MVHLINKLDSSLLDIKLVMNYLNQFQEYQIVVEDIKIGNGEIDILSGSELIKILFIKTTDGKWWSIYRYNSKGIKYEQIDVVIDDESSERGYNVVIKYSVHIEDNSYSYITCSCFSYLNRVFVRSWKQTRMVPIEELSKIQYSKDMNLTELVLMTDHKSNSIIKKDKQEDIKPLVLKLEKF